MGICLYCLCSWYSGIVVGIVDGMYMSVTNPP